MRGKKSSAAEEYLGECECENLGLGRQEEILPEETRIRQVSTKSAMLAWVFLRTPISK